MKKEIAEVDFSQVRRLKRGLYVSKARASFRVALIEPDLWRYFDSSEAVNEALRTRVRAARAGARVAR